MTEEFEKQAEIYAKEKHCIECSNLQMCWEDAIEDCCLTCKRTNEDFIAGAKWGIANAIEWHDLRKCPNDLPSSKTLADISVLLAFKSAIDGEIVVEEHIYCNTKGFIPSRDYYQGDYREPPYFKKEGVLIAWCELPQFKE